MIEEELKKDKKRNSHILGNHGPNDYSYGCNPRFPIYIHQ
jgi:hypothetical protein